ncbi:MAG: MraY family glycosyltransferase [bacterium]
MKYLYFFLFSFIVSYFFMPIMRKLAFLFKILDAPGERKVHKNPIPLLGGFGIFFSLIFVISLHFFLFFKFKQFFSFFNFNFENVMSRLIIIFIGAFIIFIIGILDDIKKISFQIRFIIQILVAIIIVFSGIRVNFFASSILGDIITIFWIVGIINAFNLLDNMDGITSGVAFISSIFFFIISIKTGQYLVPLLIATFAGSVLGFLRFNFPPAKIFMGDAGSLLLGYFLAIISIMNLYTRNFSENFLALLVPIFILAVPLFDTFSVIFIRIKNRKPIYVGDMNHFPHKLARLGFSPCQVAIFVYIVTFLTGCISLLLLKANIYDGIILSIILILIFAIIILLMEVKNNDKEKNS